MQDDAGSAEETDLPVLPAAGFESKRVIQATIRTFCTACSNLTRNGLEYTANVFGATNRREECKILQKINAVAGFKAACAPPKSHEKELENHRMGKNFQDCRIS